MLSAVFGLKDLFKTSFNPKDLKTEGKTSSFNCISLSQRAIRAAATTLLRVNGSQAAGRPAGNSAANLKPVIINLSG